MSEVTIHDLPNGIIYIENAFPESKEFLAALDENDDNSEIHSVIPKWQEWVDGGPVKQVNEDGSVEWVQVLDYDGGHRGVVKTVDWDTSLNEQNSFWPRKEISPDYDDAHKQSYEILRMIDEPYQEMLKIWSEKTGNPVPQNWITKNYTIRRYKTGGNMGAHVDKNTENPLNSMDWTALIYLNDDYEGGELVFENLGIELKPSAGSVVFFPCLEPHSVNKILSGTKTYIFLFVHLDISISTAVGEPYQWFTQIVKEDLGLI